MRRVALFVLFALMVQGAALHAPGTAVAGPSACTITGTAGPDSLVGTTGNDVICGLGGGDQIFGGAGRDVLRGGDGDDVLIGGPGADQLVGNAGLDTASYADHVVAVTADPDGLSDDGSSGEGDQIATDVENITGGSAGDVLTGNSAPNVLSGGAGADVLSGGGGDDLLLGDVGSDRFSGGGGLDTASYADHASAVSIDLDGVADDGSPGELDRIGADVENLTGGGGDDVIVGSSAANTLRGGAGADRLSGEGGDDLLLGESGSDGLVGGMGDDRLDGGPHADTVSGSEGANVCTESDVLEGATECSVVVSFSLDQASVTVSGSVVTAAGVPLAGVKVTGDNTAGGSGRTVTDGAGAFRLLVPAGSVRLTIDSGELDRRPSSLPQWFSWTGVVSVPKDIRLALTVPQARSVTVVSTDTTGAPVAGTQLYAREQRATEPRSLWPGGPSFTGLQRLADEAVTSGSDGRAAVWAFDTAASGEMQVDSVNQAGVRYRSEVSNVAVAADVEVAAVPFSGACTPAVAAIELGKGASDLVVDIDQVGVRQSASRARLLEVADMVVSGSVPLVDYNAARTGDPLRYLYDEGVALRRIAGILAYAYAATKNPAYLDAMKSKVALNAARWPDWNPGHSLDTAQVATAVALAYGWTRKRMDAGERSVVAGALVSRMVAPYACPTGSLYGKRSVRGNQKTVLATGAALAGLAVRNDGPTWASVSVSDSMAVLATSRSSDGTGYSLADGPTVEGLMYTNYEASNLALLHATLTRHRGDGQVVTAMTDKLAPLDAVARWNERCGQVADPNLDDAWERYPWVDRPTALAGMAGTPGAGPHVLELVEGLQSEDSLTVPDKGVWAVPDGIAELILSSVPVPSAPASPDQSYAPGETTAASYWGCATRGAMYAVMSSAPNNASHSHNDLGNLIVKHGEQTVLADLGQKDYNFTGTPVWRVAPKAHNTIGRLASDGRVTQSSTAVGHLSGTAEGLLMSSSNVMSGVSWTRDVSLTSNSVGLHDRLTSAVTGASTLSMSFLLATSPDRVSQTGASTLEFSLPDGSRWRLATPAGTSLGYADASPQKPYVDAADFTAIAASRTLVTLTMTLSGTLDVTSEVRRIS